MAGFATKVSRWTSRIDVRLKAAFDPKMDWQLSFHVPRSCYTQLPMRVVASVLIPLAVGVPAKASVKKRP
jgi:hypothetical protein